MDLLLETIFAAWAKRHSNTSPETHLKELVDQRAKVPRCYSKAVSCLNESIIAELEMFVKETEALLKVSKLINYMDSADLGVRMRSAALERRLTQD